MSVELLPCPFCGGKAKWNGGLGNYVTLTCRICGAYLEERVTATINKMPEANLEDAENRLIEKWNTRHYPHDVQQAVERMKLKKITYDDSSLGKPGVPEFWIAYCPECNQPIDFNDTPFEFCRRCGQRIDWSE